MLSPTDPEYIATKKIKQGTHTLSPLFTALNQWIAGRFNVHPVNSIYAQIAPDNRPRLQIILDTEEEVNVFRKNGIWNFNAGYTDEIIRCFMGLINHFGLQTEYPTRNMFVVYSSFVPLAMREAALKISATQFADFKNQFLQEDIWNIQFIGAGVIVFFYTDDQVKVYAKSQEIEAVRNGYYHLIKPYDEFNYIHRERIGVTLDSKENFEKKYDGNWMNYFR